MTPDIAIIWRYQSIIQYNYLADVNHLNFSDTSASSNTVDRWIRNLTKGRINSRVSENLLEENNLTLFSVLNFEGVWLLPFKHVFTAPFHCSDGKLCSKTFMARTGSYYYFWSKRLRSKMLRVPFASRFSMFVILPDELLSDVVELFDSETIDSQVRLMVPESVHVVLPKFKFDKLLNLDKTVKEVRRFKGENLLFLIASFSPSDGNQRYFRKHCNSPFIGSRRQLRRQAKSVTHSSSL